jgi:hypothetical protein
MYTVKCNVICFLFSFDELIAHNIDFNILSLFYRKREPFYILNRQTPIGFIFFNISQPSTFETAKNVSLCLLIRKSSTLQQIYSVYVLFLHAFGTFLWILTGPVDQRNENFHVRIFLVSDRNVWRFAK